MKQFIDMSAEDRKTMGICGRSFVEKNFDKKVVVAMTVNEL